MTPTTRRDAILLERAILSGIIRGCQNLRLRLRLNRVMSQLDGELDQLNAQIRESERMRA